MIPRLMLIVALSAAAATGAAAEPAPWTPVELPHNPTTMAMTEDGTMLFVAHEAADRISAVDVMTGAVRFGFDCPGPRHLICRGEWIFAACFEQGTVRQFNRNDGKFVKEVEAARGAHYLSAPWGEAFGGKLLVTCLGPKGPHPYLVDMNAGTATPSPEPHRAAEFLPDGTKVQLGSIVGPVGDFGQGGLGVGGDAMVRFAVGDTGATFGPNVVRCPEKRGFKLHAWVHPLKQHDTRTMILPDAVGGHFAVVDDTVLVLRRARDGKEVAAIEMELPQWLADACLAYSMGENGYWRPLPDTSRIYYVPCAATLDGRFYAFMLSNPRLARPPSQDPPVLYRLAGPFEPSREGFDEFLPMKLDVAERVTGMSLSEDGRQLLLTHEEANRLSVIDVVSGKSVAAVTIPSPRFVFARGGKVYVASSDGGLVVVDPKEWKSLDIIPVEGKRVTWMGTRSAGEFDGKIILAHAAPPWSELDVRTGQVSPVEQLWITYEAPGVPGLRFELGTSLWPGTHPGKHALARSTDALMLIPDAREPLVYSIRPWRFALHRADSNLTRLGGRATLMEKWRHGHWIAHRDSKVYYLPPQAVTLDGQLYLFASGPYPEYGVVRCVVDMPGVSTPSGGADLPNTPGVAATVPAPAPVSDFTITEDGRHMVAVHEAAGSLSVWELAGGRFVGSLSVAKPGQVLSRGGRLFVHNRADGTLSVFDASDWTLRDNVKVGPTEVVKLFAAGGPHFRGKMLAMARRKPEFLGAPDTEFLLVDVEKDSSRPVNLPEIIRCSVVDYTGRYVLVGGRNRMVNWDEFLAGKLDGPQVKGSIDADLYQVANPRFWFDRGVYGHLHVGTPPEEARKGRHIPDVLGKYVVALTQSRGNWTARVHSLDAQLTLRATATFEKMENVHTDLPLAVAVDRSVCFFTADPARGLMWMMRVALDEEVAPADFAVKEEEFPAKVRAGVPLEFKLPGAAPGDRFTLVGGPAGAGLTEDGTLRWTPGTRQAGEHEFKIRLERDGAISFVRYGTHVVAGEAPAVAGPVHLLARECRFAPGGDGASVLALAGQELLVFNRDGTLRSRGELPTAVPKILDLGGAYAAYSGNVVGFLDKQTLKGLFSVRLDHPVGDLAGRPGHPFVYAAVRNSKADNPVARHQVVAIHLASRKAAPMPRIFGERLAMDASGTYLYAALSTTYRRGYVIDWDFALVAPVYGGINLLACYQVAGPEPVFASANFNISNVSLLLPSPDAGHLLCSASHGPLRAVHAADVSKVAFSQNGSGQIADASHHPRLPMLATVESGRITIRNRADGSEQLGRLDASALQKVEAISFTPDGRSLLAMGRSAGVPTIVLLPLKLDAAQQAALAKAVPRPAPAPMPVDTDAAAPPPAIAAADAAKLTSLSGRPLREALAPRDIVRSLSDAVVVVETPTSAGTGFFVGAEGYVLASSDVLSALGEPVVRYRLRKGERIEEVRARARIVRADTERGLVLLQIAAAHKPPVVTFGPSRTLEAGENVVVLGHPGLDQESLEYTLTTGVVSHPRQVVEKREYVQTDAAIPPGSSGSPLIDSRGNVIGLILLKGAIEGAAFAVPSEELSAFLQSCTKPAQR